MTWRFPILNLWKSRALSLEAERELNHWKTRALIAETQCKLLMVRAKYASEQLGALNQSIEQHLKERTK